MSTGELQTGLKSSFDQVPMVRGPINPNQVYGQSTRVAITDLSDLGRY
jgi:hypothetical protein